ncbi:hypothetical protein GF406_22625 [candidate division KSB1 bacterium]|nr:hypothetical protein [candidate division KSB1 bacterium]
MCKRFSLLFLIIFGVGMTQCARKERDIVARVDNADFRFKQLEQSFSRKYYFQQKNETPENLTLHLHHMIHQHIKELEAKVKRMDTDSVVISALEPEINAALMQRLYQKTEAEVVNDSLIKSIYAQLGKEIQYRQIVIHKSTDGSRESKHSVVEEIFKALEQGKDFGQLARQFSEHRASAKRGGLMQPIRWQKRLDPKLVVLFRMQPGQISGPLETREEITIFKVDKVEKKDIEPFEKVKDDISALLKKHFKGVINQRFQNIVAAQVNTNRFEWNEEGLNHLEPLAYDADIKYKNFATALKHHIDLGNYITLLTYDEGKINLESLLEKYLKFKEILGENYPADINSQKEYITKLIQYERMIRLAKQAGLDQNIMQDDRVKKAISKTLIEYYDNKVIASKIPDFNEKVSKQFYETHKDSLFYQIQKVRIHVILVSNKKQADNLMRLYKHGTPFEKLGSNKFLRIFIKNLDGSIKPLQNSRTPQLARTAFQLEESEVSGPLLYDDPTLKYAIIKCISNIPEKQLSYHQVQERIDLEFKKFHMKKIENEIMESLYKKYNVQIFPHTIKKMLDRI